MSLFKAFGVISYKLILAKLNAHGFLESLKKIRYSQYKLKKYSQSIKVHASFMLSSVGWWTSFYIFTIIF